MECSQGRWPWNIFLQACNKPQKKEKLKYVGDSIITDMTKRSRFSIRYL